MVRNYEILLQGILHHCCLLLVSLLYVSFILWAAIPKHLVSSPSHSKKVFKTQRYPVYITYVFPYLSDWRLKLRNKNSISSFTNKTTNLFHVNI
jgi:hypothetical protein